VETVSPPPPSPLRQERGNPRRMPNFSFFQNRDPWGDPGPKVQKTSTDPKYPPGFFFRGKPRIEKKTRSRCQRSRKHYNDPHRNVFRLGGRGFIPPSLNYLFPFGEKQTFFFENYNQPGRGFFFERNGGTPWEPWCRFYFPKKKRGDNVFREPLNHPPYEFFPKKKFLCYPENKKKQKKKKKKKKKTKTTWFFVK